MISRSRRPNRIIKRLCLEKWDKGDANIANTSQLASQWPIQNLRCKQGETKIMTGKPCSTRQKLLPQVAAPRSRTSAWG